MEPVYIVFSDLSKFSKLTVEGQATYLKIYENQLAPQLLPYLEKSISHNTWGDAIIAIFSEPNNAVKYMLAYRKLALKYCSNLEGRQVLPRIAGHYGFANIYYDPLLNKVNVISEAVNTAARIEPITRPGEIFVSKVFKEQSFKECPELQYKIRLDQIGKLTLPKNDGEIEVFRLVTVEEPIHVLDEIFYNSVDLLNSTTQMTEAELEIIDTYTKRYKKGHCQLAELNESLDYSVDFCLKIAEMHKEYGDFEEALKWIRKIDTIKLPTFTNFDKPYSTLQRVVRLHSDILTRLGMYRESSEILLNLKNNLDGASASHESEVMARLAGQFKRFTFNKNNQLKARHEIEDSEIEFIANMYVYAFKLNIDNYYPAINAAYLFTLLGESEKIKGHKLAKYIRNTWASTNGKNIWQDMTIIETAIVLGEYERANSELKAYIENYKVDRFNLETIFEHLYQYFYLLPNSDVGEPILSLLKTNEKE